MKKKGHNFWKEIKKPVIVLAPMEDVTDVVFREVFSKFSNEEFVYFTEFTSADGLVLANQSGRDKILCRFLKTKLQKPIVAQIFSSNPKNIKIAIEKFINNKGFDGVDINMGCPDKTIIKQGAGSALINNPELAKNMVKVAKQATNLPVSVKTRIGYNNIDFEWIKNILSAKPDAAVFHLRTKKELSAVPAHWEIMKDILNIRDKISPNTLIIGNGDILSYGQAIEYAKKYKCDGVMIGRGVFGNPSFFKNTLQKRGKKERIMQLYTHVLFYKIMMPEVCKNFHSLKKHFKAYISGFSDAKILREKLMQAKSENEVLNILEKSVKIGIWRKYTLYIESIVRKALMK